MDTSGYVRKDQMRPEVHKDNLYNRFDKLDEEDEYLSNDNKLEVVEVENKKVK
jgi:hypothetical protein